MDELELLKKDWQKNNNTFEKKSTSDLYAMLHKKSSNIVKTLFYISIAELAFWILVNTIPMFSSDGYKQQLQDMYKDSLFIGITIFTYAVILLFVYSRLVGLGSEFERPARLPLQAHWEARPGTIKNT